MFKSFRTWFDERLQVLAHTDPKRARHWHNPADPVQAARIEAAAVKRARRADKLRMTASALPNRAHLLSYNRNSLNPFYIAK